MAKNIIIQAYILKLANMYTKRFLNKYPDLERAEYIATIQLMTLITALKFGTSANDDSMLNYDIDELVAPAYLNQALGNSINKWGNVIFYQQANNLREPLKEMERIFMKALDYKLITPQELRGKKLKFQNFEILEL